MTNKLCFGDCLDVMREEIPDESVDLIYLDPPFNSKRIYNASMGGARWIAFNDTWRWHEAIDDFDEVAKDVTFAPTIEGLRRILGEGPELAYLSYMSNRLRECRRVLKDTGSLYLHCDPPMSHYLKVVMDGVFERENFLNEIVWCYASGGVGKKRFAKKHDVILFYSKNKNYVFNPQYRPYSKGTVQRGLTRYKKNLNDSYELRKEGAIENDWWTDIKPLLSPTMKERLGYPTQKPLALLDRIIKASSNKGDTILDPFCGCGTTIEAAERNERKWTGIDVCVKACQVIERRMRGHFDSLWNDVEFIGLPKTLEDSKTLAAMDKFRFEKWAASLVDGMEANKKQRGDGGIDGRGRLTIRRGEFIDLVSQVKSGSTGPGDVQAFNGARQQAGADLGIFTCFEERVTPGMRDAAASTGRFMGVPTVQIYTIEDFFEGRKPIMPGATRAAISPCI